MPHLGNLYDKAAQIESSVTNPTKRFSSFAAGEQLNTVPLYLKIKYKIGFFFFCLDLQYALHNDPAAYQSGVRTIVDEDAGFEPGTAPSGALPMSHHIFIKITLKINCDLPATSCWCPWSLAGCPLSCRLCWSAAYPCTCPASP